LQAATAARTGLDDLIGLIAAQARVAGASWSAIATRLGVTRQAAQQRYGPAADQLLRQTIRANARQAELTGEQLPTRQAALTRRSDRHLLACDLIDGWTLWELDDTDDGADTALAVRDDIDETDVAGGQQWATTVLRIRGIEATEWTTVPGRLDHSAPGWSPVVVCRPPVEAPAPGARSRCHTRCINGNGSASDHRAGGPADALVRVDGRPDRGMHCHCTCHDHG